jgi:hypothetical protein
MAQKKKKSGGNPAAKSDPLAVELYGILRRSVEMTQKLENDPRITREQWEWFRGGTLAAMAIYSILMEKPNAISVIIKEYDDAMLCPTCAGPNRTVKGIECPTCGCPPRD